VLIRSRSLPQYRIYYTHSLIGIHNVLCSDLPPHLLGVHRALLTVEHVDLGVQTNHRLIVDVVFTGKDIGRTLAGDEMNDGVSEMKMARSWRLYSPGAMNRGNLSNIREIGLDD
jgi:hypothetical protein